jgi:hypothetical protein
LIYYSKTTKGFYNSDLGYAKLPADVVEISEDAHSALITGSNAGQVIVPDENGSPVLQDRIITPAEQQRSLVAQAQTLLKQTDEVVLGYFENDDHVPHALKAYRSALRAVTSGASSAIPTAPALT